MPPTCCRFFTIPCGFRASGSRAVGKATGILMAIALNRQAALGGVDRFVVAVGTVRAFLYLYLLSFVGVRCFPECRTFTSLIRFLRVSAPFLGAGVDGIVSLPFSS